MVWEVDQFLDRELVLAEVELASADALVTVPAWLAVQVVREVTGEAGYQNSVLAG
jgi:CYTH domain-containing protein